MKKIELYSRLEAEELMNEEQQQRILEKNSRSAKLRELMLQKKHSILTEEINKSPAVQLNKSNLTLQAREVERDFKDELFELQNEELWQNKIKEPVEEPQQSPVAQRNTSLMKKNSSIFDLIDYNSINDQFRITTIERGTEHSLVQFNDPTRSEVISIYTPIKTIDMRYSSTTSNFGNDMPSTNYKTIDSQSFQQIRNKAQTVMTSPTSPSRNQRINSPQKSTKQSQKTSALRNRGFMDKCQQDLINQMQSVVKGNVKQQLNKNHIKSIPIPVKQTKQAINSQRSPQKQTQSILGLNSERQVVPKNLKASQISQQILHPNSSILSSQTPKNRIIQHQRQGSFQDYKSMLPPNIKNIAIPSQNKKQPSTFQNSRQSLASKASAIPTPKIFSQVTTPKASQEQSRFSLQGLNKNASNPILEFLNKCYEIFDCSKIAKSGHKKSISIKVNNSPKRKASTTKNQSSLKLQDVNPELTQFEVPDDYYYQTQRNYLSNTFNNSSMSGLKTPQNLNITESSELFKTLISQKNQMIAQAYKQSLETSKKVQQDAQLTLQRQKSLQKLEKEQKKLKVVFDKQDKQNYEQQKKIEEIDYIKYRTEFHTRMNSVDKSQKEIEKKKLRESSISSQEYMRNYKKLNQEKEQIFYHEINEKSYNELLWKKQQEKLEQKQKSSELKLKKQEFAIYKIIKNEELIKRLQQENELLNQQQLKQSKANINKVHKSQKSVLTIPKPLIEFKSHTKR
eukprot:403342340